MIVRVKKNNKSNLFGRETGLWDLTLNFDDADTEICKNSHSFSHLKNLVKDNL